MWIVTIWGIACSSIPQIQNRGVISGKRQRKIITIPESKYSGLNREYPFVGLEMFAKNRSDEIKKLGKEAFSIERSIG